MSRISDAFAAAEGEGRAALVTFITAGDPDPEAGREVLAAVARGGADVVELGLPFSDPSADGAAIQRSSARALEAGMTYAKTLAMVADLRAGRIDGASPELPIVLFGYANPFFARGEALGRELAEAGVDGVLVVDLPPEEAGEFEALLRPAGVDLIRLVAPTTPLARVAKIAAGASGFLYYVSMLGVTGDTLRDPGALAPRVAEVRRQAGLPVGVGFGIADPEAAAAVAGLADGVVVGSAIVRKIEAEGAAAGPAVEAFVRGLAQACRGGEGGRG